MGFRLAALRSPLLGANRLRLADRELSHGGPTDNPGVTAKISMDSFVEVTDVVFFWLVRCNDAAVDAGHHMHDHMRLHGILETGDASRWLI